MSAKTAKTDLLVRTGPGTPMGDLLRRYWVPALLTEEIPEPDCPPVRVKLMGERLLGFRDSKGRPGLIREKCAHRGVSLFFGRNEDCGIRCAYHGWKFDIHGQCVDLPSHPAMAERVEDSSLSLHRAGRCCLGLYGTARAQARTSGLGVEPRSGVAPLRLQAAARMQLSAGHGRRHRHVARLVRASFRVRCRSVSDNQRAYAFKKIHRR